MSSTGKFFTKSALALAVTVVINNTVHAVDALPAINKSARSLVEYAGEDLNGVAVTGDGNGLFLEVWSNSGQDVYAQYSQRGNPVGAAFLVATSTGVSNVRATMNASGSAVVIWYGTSMYDSSMTTALFARLLPANSVSVSGDPVFLSDEPYGASDVAMDDSGNFNVVKNSNNTFYHFNAAGVAGTSTEFTSNCSTFSNNMIDYSGHFKLVSYEAPYSIDKYCSPSVSTNAAGQSVVVWDESGHIYAKRFDNTGAIIDSQPILVDGTPAKKPASIGSKYQNKVEYFLLEPEVAMDDAGDFVVAWERIKATNSTVKKKILWCTYDPYSYYTYSCSRKLMPFVKSTIGSSIVAQRFMGGVPVSGSQALPKDRVLVKGTNKRNRSISIDMDTVGNFSLAWNVNFEVAPPRGFYGSPIYGGNIQARKYKNTLSPASGLITVAKTSKLLKNGDYNYNILPGIVLDEQGSWEVVWNRQSVVTEQYVGYYGYTYSNRVLDSESFARYTPGKGVK